MRYRINREYPTYEDTLYPARFREITKCFIRKDHICGKFLGASKSCFIACPDTEEVETILALITEKLTKIGIETIIAIKERAYGQDIFCTKICGKIIESQFCIVILDDTVGNNNKSNINIPNPNVYYEYGLMTALGKHVIPLQKERQDLAFNIQTHDTIKYTNRNLPNELDRAFKDAVKMTQEDRTSYEHTKGISERIFGRSLEINGYSRKDYEEDWFLSEDCEDTDFSIYVHDERNECLFFSVIRDIESLTDALTDMQVISKRLESQIKQLSDEIIIQSEEKERLDREIEDIDSNEKVNVVIRSRIFRTKERINILLRNREDNNSKIELINTSKFALILSPEVIELKEKVINQYDTVEKKILSLPLYIGDSNSIKFDGVEIIFKVPKL